MNVDRLLWVAEVSVPKISFIAEVVNKDLITVWCDPHAKSKVSLRQLRA